jgi:hypothetical protein
MLENIRYTDGKKTREIMDLERPNPCFKIPLYEFELFI